MSGMTADESLYWGDYSTSEQALGTTWITSLIPVSRCATVLYVVLESCTEIKHSARRHPRLFKEEIVIVMLIIHLFSLA